MPDYRNKVLIISVQKEAIAATYEKSEEPIEQDSLSHQSIISQEIIPEPTIKMTTPQSPDQRKSSIKQSKAQLVEEEKL